MVGGAWWAAVHSDAQSRTRLKRLSTHACIREGNGNSLQCSCLENPRGRGAWWAAVYGITQSRTRLKRLSSSSSSPKHFCLVHIRLIRSIFPKLICNWWIPNLLFWKNHYSWILNFHLGLKSNAAFQTGKEETEGFSSCLNAWWCIVFRYHCVPDLQQEIMVPWFAHCRAKKGHTTGSPR